MRSRQADTAAKHPRTAERKGGQDRLPRIADALLALQRGAGNRAVQRLLDSRRSEAEAHPPARGAAEGAVVQRLAAFTRGNKPVDVGLLSLNELKLTERVLELDAPIPASWWLSREPDTLSQTQLRSALRAVVAAPTDYGSFDLDRTEDVTRLCRAMIEVAGASGPPGTSSATPPATSTPATPGNPVPSPKATPAIRVIPAPASEPSVRGVQKQLRAVYLTSDNKQQVISTLGEWAAYAKVQDEILSKGFYDLRRERDRLGDDYYDSPDASFRRNYRRVSQLRVNMNGAKSECEAVLHRLMSARSERPEQFAALYDGEQLQGVVEWGGAADYIANIVGNPYNIIPKDAPPVGGVAKALLILTVAQYRVEEVRPRARQDPHITLFALNNKVKGIYDHFYFRVLSRSGPIERPIRGQKETDKLGRLKPLKTEWHKTYNMIMTAEGADKLLRTYEPGKWLTVPDQLKPYLEPRT